MVEPILYASFGALIAMLIGLTFLPLFWRRAVKLTTRDLIARLPVSASEIVATQDRLRAEHAMSLRQTERKAELVVGDATRDRIESARARATELGHLADLADLRSQVSALESEGVRVRGELDRTGAEAVAAFEALKEARAASDAAARDLQAARQDASASRSAMEQARIEASAREREIARLKEKAPETNGDGAPKTAPHAAVSAPSAVSQPASPATPFGKPGDGAATAAAKAQAPVEAAKAEPDAGELAALRTRLDEVADALVKAAEAAPAEMAMPASHAAPASETPEEATKLPVVDEVATQDVRPAEKLKSDEAAREPEKASEPAYGSSPERSGSPEPGRAKPPSVENRPEPAAAERARA